MYGKIDYKARFKRRYINSIPLLILADILAIAIGAGTFFLLRSAFDGRSNVTQDQIVSEETGLPGNNIDNED